MSTNISNISKGAKPKQPVKGGAKKDDKVEERKKSASDDEIDYTSLSKEDVFGRRGSVGRSPPPSLKEFRASLLTSGGHESGKRKRIEEEEVLDKRVALLRGIGDEVRDFLFTETNKVSKSVMSFILNKWAQAEDLLTDVLADLRSAEQVSKARPQTPQMQPPVSFAKVVASKPDPLAKSQKKQNIVILKPKEGSKIETSEGVKEIIYKSVMPTLKKVKVRNVRKIRDKGILIETDSEEDLKAIKETVARQVHNIKVDEPRKIGPKLLIFDVEREMTESQILEEIYHRNVVDMGISEDEFKKVVQFRFRTGPKKGKLCNVIVEVSGQIRRYLLARDRVFMKWNAHRVKDFDLVSRCFKCFSYGHISKFCTAKEMLCRHCGDAGHSLAECQKRKEAPVCKNCKEQKKDHAHSVTDPKCPEYKRALERYRSRISYD